MGVFLHFFFPLGTKIHVCLLCNEKIIGCLQHISTTSLSLSQMPNQENWKSKNQKKKKNSQTQNAFWSSKKV